MDEHYHIVRSEAHDSLEKAYHIHASKGPIDLHMPCTLDQSYYKHLERRTSNQRNRTQVVVKYADRNRRRQLQLALAETDASKPLLAEPRPPQPNLSGRDAAGDLKPVVGEAEVLGVKGTRLVMVNQMWLWKIGSGAYLAPSITTSTSYYFLVPVAGPFICQTELTVPASQKHRYSHHRISTPA